MNVAGNISKGFPKFTKQRSPGTWTRHAACLGHDPNLWFRDEHDHTTYTHARNICAHCPVKSDCLAWALETNTQHGIFGGLTPRQRQHLRLKGGSR